MESTDAPLRKIITEGSHILHKHIENRHEILFSQSVSHLLFLGDVFGEGTLVGDFRENLYPFWIFLVFVDLEELVFLPWFLLNVVNQPCELFVEFLLVAIPWQVNVLQTTQTKIIVPSYGVFFAEGPLLLPPTLKNNKIRISNLIFVLLHILPPIILQTILHIVTITNTTTNSVSLLRNHWFLCFWQIWGQIQEIYSNLK